jgi:uncharacterized membrane protein YfcA
MTLPETSLVVAVGFLVSILSVSVGGTALIVVPLMIWLGMAPASAIATNKFGILFLSIMGAATFLRDTSIPRPRIVMAFLPAVIAGSVLGAVFVVSAPQNTVKLIIGAATIVVAIVLLLKPQAGIEPARSPAGWGRIATGIGLALPLSVFGGFFSGGYATLLTYLLVFALGLTFLQAVALTRLLGIFSALAACTYLGIKGAIDYSVGIPLAAAFMVGGRIGARLAIRRGNRWLKAVFVAVAIVLALRLIGAEVIEHLEKRG